MRMLRKSTFTCIYLCHCEDVRAVEVASNVGIMSTYCLAIYYVVVDVDILTDKVRLDNVALRFVVVSFFVSFCDIRE